MFSKFSFALVLATVFPCVKNNYSRFRNMASFSLQITWRAGLLVNDNLNWLVGNVFVQALRRTYQRRITNYPVAFKQQLKAYFGTYATLQSSSQFSSQLYNLFRFLKGIVSVFSFYIPLNFRFTKYYITHDPIWK